MGTRLCGGEEPPFKPWSRTPPQALLNADKPSTSPVRAKGLWAGAKGGSKPLLSCSLVPGKSEWNFGSLVALEIDFFYYYYYFSFFTILKNGLTHSCMRLWGLTADHLFQLLTVINSFVFFATFETLWGKKSMFWMALKEFKVTNIFFLRETMCRECSCSKRNMFLLAF